MSSKPVLKIDWATHEAAKFACKNWHYSKSVPPPPLVKFGVWEDDKYIGAVLFSRGANNNLSKPYALTQQECCELTRVALANHITPVSRIIKVCISLLKKRAEGLRLVVSFADCFQGHVGAIYQAGNWIYCGTGSSSTEYLAPDGKIWHGRMVSKTGKTRVFGAVRNVWKHSECTPIEKPGKHRYLFPLDAEMKKQILPLSKPYPKRDKQATAEDHSDSGGAAPTVTLQSL